MEKTERKYDGNIEINDLIDDRVNNALARRNEIQIPEDNLLDLSNDQLSKVTGGSWSIWIWFSWTF